MITGHPNISFPPGAIPLGKNIEEVKALALAATFVIERAAARCAYDLTARAELDKGEHIIRFDAFVNALIEEAEKAPLDGFQPDDEAGAKETLCTLIRKLTERHRMRLIP